MSNVSLLFYKNVEFEKPLTLAICEELVNILNVLTTISPVGDFFHEIKNVN